MQLPVPEGREAALRTFYGRLIGLRERTEPGATTLRFETGFQRLDLVPMPPFAMPFWSGHAVLHVSSAAPLRNRLHAAGCHTNESVSPPGHHGFSVQDPAGNRLHVIELPGRPRASKTCDSKQGGGD